MKHTPGPWRIEPVLCNGNPNNTHMVCGGRTGTPAEQCYIADCRVSSYYRTKEETDANAHLIAAAPELLAACKRFEKELREFVESEKGDIDNFPSQDLMYAILAAIAKAEGK